MSCLFVDAMMHLGVGSPARQHLFVRFTAIRVPTYTSKIPTVLRLIQDCYYFKCIFGHGGVLNRDEANLLRPRKLAGNWGFLG